MEGNACSREASARTQIDPGYKRKGREYCHVIIDGTGTKSYKTPEEYEQAVLSHLRHSRTGRAVFPEFVNGSQHRLKIVPGPELYPDTVAKDPSHGLKKGTVAYERYDVESEGPPSLVGLGGGSDAEVRFSPYMFGVVATLLHDPGPGREPDEVLFHEMVHATRMTRGIGSPIPVHVNCPRPFFCEWYKSEDEFFAILLANIYASETGRRYLRLDWAQGSQRLIDDTDAKFLPKRDNTEDHYRLVDKLVLEDPRMASELRMVQAPFNPIRRYFELQRTPPDADKPDF